MSTPVIILTVALSIAVSLLILRHKALSHRCINGFYALCGALAWYTIEAVERSEAIYLSMLTALLLCLLPMLVDSLLILSWRSKAQRERV